MENFDLWSQLAALGQVIAIDLVLAGDNAIVVGMAAAGVPLEQRRRVIFWGIGAFQVVRYRRKALVHLARVHPGAIEQLKRGETFVHPGIGDREGV